MRLRSGIYTCVKKVAVGCLFLSLALPRAYAGPGDDADLLKTLRQIDQNLSRTTPNSFQVPISTFERPEQVKAQIVELQRHIAGKPPAEVRSIVLKALMVLYSGRGNTQPRDGKGWYLLNRSGETGKPEIQWILNQGLLDTEGKREFEAFLASHDFSDAQKKAAGFPPQFHIGDAMTRDEIQEWVQAAPHTAYGPSLSKALGKEPTLGELIDQSKVSGEEKEALKKAVGSLVEKNLYDESVSTLNDPKKEFVDYFGRSKESSEILNAFTKMEKGHVLLTGKAGTGKTTILKMLSDGFMQGKYQIRNEPPPVILELPITSVTNPTDPSAIKATVAAAKELSKAINRRVILYVDEAHISTPMTRNALKSFLTEMNKPSDGESKVNMVFSTTSDESKTFLQDSAFSRRFTEVHVPEFNREETIQLIKQAYLKRWQTAHDKSGYKLGQISDDAYEYAYRYASLEQPHAGNPTGTKELLESAIVAKMNDGSKHGLRGEFTLASSDVQNYIRSHLGQTLVPGDPEFEKKVQEKWLKFNADYTGNEAVKAEIEPWLRSHFSNLNKGKMSAMVVFGPPGGGKSYLAEQLSKHFFNGAMLTINGAEFKNGGLELNKLIGSPVGTVGSEKQRSILTKFIKENPGGGLIKIEEADYLHQDVIQLLTNMITDKKFVDGLGKEWDTSRFVIQMNSNLGQDLMIPTDSKNKMNWEQFETRRKQLTEKALVNGKEIERVRPEKLGSVFDQFVETIVTKSNPGDDTSAVSQEANKQKRRYKAVYVMPPSKEDLEQAAKARVAKFVHDSQADYGVKFVIPDEAVQKLIDLDHYEFEKGYSYVNEKLEDKLFNHLNAHLHERGKRLVVKVQDSQAIVNGREVPAQSLVVSPEGDAAGASTYSLGAVHSGEKNPWGDNPEMMKRIKNFSRLMSQHIKGNDEIIENLKAMHKQKAFDWNAQNVATYLGTTGNGKTELVKAEAKVLYGTEDAMFKISGLNHKYDLANYFRPPKGVQGGNEQTEFERWFLSRLHSGGGIILFDELLSLHGLHGEALSNKIAVINELYDLLDEGKIRIGNKIYDARAFQVRITGNALQDAFKGIGDDPDSERLVKKIVQSMSREQITKALEQYGIDPPKAARLGLISVLGPQPRAVTQEVGKLKVQNLIREIQSKSHHPVEITVDDQAIESVVKNLSTNELGLRNVDQGFSVLLKRPLTGILTDLPGVRKIELRTGTDGQVHWFADGKEVALEGAKIPGTTREETNWNYLSEFEAGSSNRTPQIKDLGIAPRLQYSPEALKSVATHEVYGHWMTDAILNRKNGAEAISLIAGDGYLGYVRPSVPSEVHLSNLSSMMKEAIVLQAGHRAVFQTGSFATGGGNDGSPRDPRKPSNDDLGKIDKIFNQMINNRVVAGISETSSPVHKQQVKQFLNDVLDHATDRVIQDGVKSGQFDPVFNHVVKERFISKEDLDSYLSKVDFEKFGDPDVYFSKVITDAFEQASRDRRLDKTPGLKKSVGGTLSRLLEETKARAQSKPAALSEISKVETKASEFFGHTPGPAGANATTKCLINALNGLLEHP